MASGQLIMVVGPSGAGKDSILALVKAAMPDLVFVRRTITRPADDGFEDHVPVSDDEFEALSKTGEFLMEWAANGLRYGIPKSVSADLARGNRVVFNGSRGALPQIAEAYPDIFVLSIEVSKDVLRDRLERRGRETPEAIEARLARDVPDFPAGVQVEVIDNSGPLENAVAQMIDAISRQTRDGTAA
ncbi:MAG: phosphonate metabolism protein/1,5-bisphosphokinase (PRPP-forming) PhnN [Pseudomonadota bacterium]